MAYVTPSLGEAVLYQDQQADVHVALVVNVEDAIQRTSLFVLPPMDNPTMTPYIEYNVFYNSTKPPYSWYFNTD